MKQGKIRYEKVEDPGAERLMRWNACQIASKQLFKSTQKTDEIVEVVRMSFEDQIDVKISLKK